MKKLLLIVLLFSVIRVDAVEFVGDSKSRILVEYSTGEVLYEMNSNERLALASMTKMMTLLITMETINEGNLNYDDDVIISEEAASMGGSQLFLAAGDKIKVSELIKGVSIASANDAAVALSEAVAGSSTEFVSMMNAKADSMGLSNTHFMNVHGLDEDDHYSSAYDMSRIALELIKYDDILKYTSIYEDYFNRPDGTKIWLVNTNKLVRYYDGVDGLKTGFTSNAMYCITTTALRNNIRFISVVMGSSTSEIRNAETVKLLDYGFNNYKLNTLFKKSYDFGNIKVEKGNTKFGSLRLIDDATVLLKNSDKVLKYDKKIVIDKDIAPIKSGEVVGKLQLYSKGRLVMERDLTISESIDRRSLIGSIGYVLGEVFNGRSLSN